MGYIIRKATNDDVLGIAYVHYHAWIETYTGLVSQDFLDKLSVARSAEKLRNIDCSKYFVLEIDGKICGFICISEYRGDDLGDEYGEIPAIYLLKEYHGHHYGTKLLDKAMEELKKWGYRKIVIRTLKNNINAIKFYERSGFLIDGVEKEIDLGKPETVIRLIKDMF